MTLFRRMTRNRLVRFATIGATTVGLGATALVLAHGASAATVTSVTKVQAVTTSAAAPNKQIDADCPAGTIATGVEAYVTVPAGQTQKPQVNISNAMAGNGGGQAWGHVYAETTTPASAGMKWILNVWVTCVTGWSDVQHVQVQGWAEPNQPQQTVTASCPTGKVLLGVGHQGNGAVRIQAITTVGGTTVQVIANKSPEYRPGTRWLATADAVCARGPKPLKVQGRSVTDQKSRKTGTAACGDKQAITGGFEVVNGDGAATMLAEYRLSSTFSVTVFNHGPLSHPSTLRPWTYCA